MKTKLEIVNLNNNDVISTSSVSLFNTAYVVSYNKWFFYNADLVNGGRSNDDKYIYRIDSYPSVKGVDESLYEEYKALVDDDTFETGKTYHYTNGQWIKCSDGLDHGPHVN